MTICGAARRAGVRQVLVPRTAAVFSACGIGFSDVSQHYEQPLTSEAQRRITAEIETMVREYREAEHKHTGYTSLRDSDVLKALVFLLRLAHGRTSGRPKSRAFVEFLFAQFPEKEAAVLAPQEAASRIILP